LLRRSDLGRQREPVLSNVATETEAKEILIQAAELYSQVKYWITKNDPVVRT
jgi:hypothetical protein